jgi:catechol 2,3-dioxygenase-like lactoylglutathione lyase family enzyme
MPKTDRPSLENLRKRAKTLVRQHRTGYHPVAAKLRAAVPRFASLADQTILDATFTLADAQRVIAREAGYADWTQATKELENMSNPTKLTSQEPLPRLRIAFPQLFVADVQRAADHYKSLGFQIAYLYGAPPFYGLIARDDVGLNLRCVAPTQFDQSLREREHLLSANIVVDGVKALFLEFRDRGADFAQTLTEQPWGATDFVLRDPDGNLVCFASPASAPSP